MHNVTISVVIPCYNSAAWLCAAVASVWAQTHRDIELILVDDGSNDETPALIARLIANAKASGRLARSALQANAGVAAARNLGISLASGRYILPLDADDTLHPSMLAECTAILEAEPHLDIVYTDRQDFGDSARHWPAGQFELAKLKYFNQLAYCALYRRSMWLDLGGYQSNVSGFDDWDFWLKAALHGAQAHYLPRPYFLHRRHSGSQLWGLLPHYEKLYAQIILNNQVAFSEAEKAGADAFLEQAKPFALLRSSRFIFMREYYRGYPGATACAY